MLKMKNISIIYIILFVFGFIDLFAQENSYKLFPQNGHEYIYEFQEKTYWGNDDGEKRDMLVSKKKLRIRYETILPERKEYLFVDVLENSVEDPLSKVTSFKDYRFPEFRDGFYDERYADFYEGLLCRVIFQYEFDSESASVKLENRAEILEKMQDILKEKGLIVKD